MKFEQIERWKSRQTDRAQQAGLKHMMKLAQHLGLLTCRACNIKLIGFYSGDRR